MQNQLLSLGISIFVVALSGQMSASVALPPPEDVPEEVLRTQIITEARSPFDGEPLTPAEYAQLQAQLAQSPFAPQLSPKLRQLIFLLQARKLLKTFIPF
ncbi:MAG: hypothetical protein AB4038_08040 [Prochloraceae cyanobacterium]